MVAGHGLSVEGRGPAREDSIRYDRWKVQVSSVYLISITSSCRCVQCAAVFYGLTCMYSFISRTLLCRTDFTTGSNRTFLININEYYLPWTVTILAIYSVDLF